MNRASTKSWGQRPGKGKDERSKELTPCPGCNFLLCCQLLREDRFPGVTELERVHPAQVQGSDFKGHGGRIDGSHFPKVLISTG